MQPNPVKVSIIGITGYTGLELLRLCLAHPLVEIAHLTSRQHDDVSIGDVYPHLAHTDLRITNTDHMAVAKDSDVVFLALPHKTAQDVVADLHGSVKVVDLSADYRLDDVETYEKHYTSHAHPELLNEVIYGAPEFHHDEIKGTSTIANPGCFALLAQFMLAPFAGHIEHADIMAVTGSSGSGKSASEGTHHPVRSHNMKSYNINAHRHIPEITRTAKINEEQLNFVPTSGPFVRGIFATAFVKTGADPKPYEATPFIRTMDNVALANVVGSNYCDLSFKKTNGGYIVQGALDNLVKGAAGCAIQNMNLMCGFDETLGLDTIAPLYP